MTSGCVVVSRCCGLLKSSPPFAPRQVVSLRQFLLLHAAGWPETELSLVNDVRLVVAQLESAINALPPDEAVACWSDPSTLPSFPIRRAWPAWPRVGPRPASSSPARNNSWHGWVVRSHVGCKNGSPGIQQRRCGGWWPKHKAKTDLKHEGRPDELRYFD